ncbi:hypothetical protein K7X08_027197 [Anisodus acutangulus]|uniref:non-specific serine/threonine protein kinase n=1 Tax=Anisodus acutangulus TaxID=402998 RepID=A0A9Q1MIG5_9SOLA|nr:hypothetical protein K7X08_027197 [Anisodus acutangulus]
MAFLRCFGNKLRRGGVGDVRVYAEGDKDDELNSRMITGATRYTSDELKRFTMNFSKSNLIACAGFSTVYLAKFPDSTLKAVKIMDSSSERLNRIYKQELDILVQIQHDNIVKLLDHCDDEEFGNMLVFEYVPNGTLHDKLHGNRGIIPWRNRMAVAFQLAQAIDGERLISKAAPILNDVSKVAEMVDPHLDRNYALEEAKVMVTLAASCLSDFPSLRPSASEILETIRSRISSISFLFSADKKV